jgi:DNA repair exonuclease SbcCD nuclease subunit
MAKLILFSDLHAHPFKQYATILSNGMNSRLMDAINCIAQVYEHAIAVGADVVLFGGDLFHVRKTIPVVAFNAVYEQMAKFVGSRIPVIMIHGNHDQADRVGNVHSIHAFRSFLEVIDKPGWNEVRCANGEELQLMAVPYIENIPQLQEAVSTPCPHPGAHKLLLGHLGIQGAKVGADFVYTNPHDAALSDLNVSAFDAVFLGHYHEYQQLASNAWYIGAPLQHNWGDRGSTRGFILYDTETRTHEHIPLTAPKFVQLAEGEELVGGQDGFVRLVSSAPWTEVTREAARAKMGARSLEIVRPKDASLTATPQRMVIDPAQSPEEVLEKYVLSGATNLDGLDDNYLIQMGREIMREAEENI